MSGGGVREILGGESEIPVDLVRGLLGFLRRRLGMRTAWLSSFTSGMQVFDTVDAEDGVCGVVSTGDRLRLSQSYCVRVVDGRLPIVIPDTAANPVTATLAVTGELGIGSYVGVPVLDRDETAIGMVCLIDTAPHPLLAEADIGSIEQVAALMGTLIRSGGRDTDEAARRAAIRRVVAERDFEVVFQSVHDVATGTVVGVEALARFPCPPFRPNLVFAAASQMGLGLELQIAVVARALSLVPQLPNDVFVSVNLSPTAALMTPWTALLGDVDPGRIVLEITEHDAVANYAALDDVLQSCRQRGLRVAIDDVGAGYSSFAHVLELDPEFIKIDQSIIRDLDSDDARRRLVCTIADFASQIGATVIAEGVQTQAELDEVGAAGVAWAQGFLLSRPAPHDLGFAPAVAATPSQPAALADAPLLSERHFELALAHSPIGMAIVDADGRFLRTNRALEAMLGYSRQTLARSTFQQISHPDDLQADLRLFGECLAGRRRTYRMDKRFITAGGEPMWCDLTVVRVPDPRGGAQPCFVAQILDVTTSRVRELELARRAATDPLTGLPNRSTTSERLRRLHAAGDGYSVLFCDIARFKSVNDERGHHCGDETLIEVARRLGGAVADADLVGRWGGDEFLVVTPHVADTDLQRLAERIDDHLHRSPIELGAGSHEAVTVSIGIATHHPNDDRTIEAVVDRADQAMYRNRAHQ